MLHGILRQLGPGADQLDDIIREDASKNLSDVDFIATETINWLGSRERKLQLKGNAYYNYEQDVLKRDKSSYTTDEDGAPIPLNDNKRNCSHIIDNQYANMVDQKINYILGKPFSLQTDNKSYTDALNLVFDKCFKRMLHNIAIDALNGGIAWVHPYYNEQGELVFKRFPAHEIYPFWSDDEHTVLDMAIRYYTTITYIGRNPTTVEHVEVFSKDNIKKYVLSGGRLIIDKDNPEIAYAVVRDNDMPIQLSWDKIPLVAFKYNQREIPLIKRIKNLQDAINNTRSNWQDNMEEDIRDTIWVIKNFDGENVPEFRQKLMKYGAVKVSDNGGIEALRIERDSESFTTFIKETKRALIENARGFDAKDDRVGTNPNEMNLRSMYADIDLDADMMEIQFQASFDQLLWFVDKYLQNAGLGDFSKEEVKLTFDRNMIVNDSETITNVKNSVGVVSEETLLAHHPFVSDVQTELTRMKKQRAEEENKFGQYQGLGGDAANANS